MYDKAGVKPANNLPELIETTAKLTKDLGGPYGIGVRGSRSWAATTRRKAISASTPSQPIPKPKPRRPMCGSGRSP
jgi:hypothetical protein